MGAPRVDSDKAHDHLEPEEWPVLAAFGRVMLSAQLLETTTFQLAHLDHKTPNGFERAVRQIEGQLKHPKTDPVDAAVRGEQARDEGVAKFRAIWRSS